MVEYHYDLPEEDNKFCVPNFCMYTVQQLALSAEKLGRDMK